MENLKLTEAITQDQFKFYAHLFSNFNKYIEIRLIKEGSKTKQLFLTYEELLNYQPPKDTNVYIGVYERRTKWKGTEKTCTKTNAIYLDFDNTTLEAIKHAIDVKGIPLPSMIVNSGHGYHVYWKLDKPAGRELKPIIRKLQQTLNSDSAAVDIARILRVPDTMNVKETPISSKLEEINSNTTTIKELESILGVKAIVENDSGTGSIKELENIKYNGLNNMSKGVKEGERNFCTGRIVQTLQKLNFSKAEVKDIVFRWNSLNNPRKKTKELKQDIHVFWHDKRYKYYGKEFKIEDRLQELNLRFIDNETLFFESENNNYHRYDNDLLGDKFSEVNGLTFAILSIVQQTNKGKTLKEIADLCKRNTRDKTLLKSIDLLVTSNHLNKESKPGSANIYTFKEKPFLNKRGFTSVPRLLHKYYIETCNARELEKELKRLGKNITYDRLNETRYKLLILLESYAYGIKTEVYPSNRTLADRMRLTTETIKNNLKWLEDKDFIEISKQGNTRLIKLIYR